MFLKYLINFNSPGCISMNIILHNIISEEYKLEIKKNHRLIWSVLKVVKKLAEKLDLY